MARVDATRRHSGRSKAGASAARTSGWLGGAAGAILMSSQGGGHRPTRHDCIPTLVSTPLENRSVQRARRAGFRRG